MFFGWTQASNPTSMPAQAAIITKQGYRPDDGVVTCRYCNMKFPIYKLEKGLGSCYPIRIAGRAENGNYLISLAELEGAAKLF